MKNILIITEKLDSNHEIFGFFHAQILDFVKECKIVSVICLEESSHNLQGKVNVLSLGKEKQQSKIMYIKNFYMYIWQERKNYDVVFVHLNPVYVVMAGLFWRLFNKTIVLWYNHTQVSLILRIAEKLAHKIYTPSKESFRLKSKKVSVISHEDNIPAAVCGDKN